MAVIDEGDGTFGQELTGKSEVARKKSLSDFRFFAVRFALDMVGF